MECCRTCGRGEAVHSGDIEAETRKGKISWFVCRLLVSPELGVSVVRRIKIMDAKGCFVLQGGDEFRGDMAIADRRAIELAGGKGARIRIIPAAAAPDNNHERAGSNGKLWFESLGAEDVSVLPLIDFESAQNSEIVDALETADLVFLLGGFPGHLADSLRQSKSLQAIKTAYENGAVLAGSSAGAMVLCEQFYDPHEKKYAKGLNMVPHLMILPHFNRSGHQWEQRLKGDGLNGFKLLGIDEQTAVISDGPEGRWQVYGKGNATLITKNQKRVYKTSSILQSMK